MNCNSRRPLKIARCLPFGVVSGVVLAISMMPPANAASSLGYASRTNLDGGAGCSVGCHGFGDQNSTVTISGPTTLAAGQMGFYTVTNFKSGVPNATRMGVNIAASDVGSLSETASNLVVDGTTNQIVHTTASGTVSLNTTTSGSASYAFRYTMPGGAGVGTNHTLYATSRLGSGPNAGSAGWNHAPNFTVTTAGVFTALLGGSATPAAFVFGQTGTLSTSGGETSGGVTYSSSNTSVCTISSTTLTAVGVGSCTITASKPLTATSSALSDSFTLTVNQASQSALTTLIGGSASPGASTVFLTGVLSTSGGSGTGAVTYASQTGTICTVVGSTVSYIASGNCIVRGTKAADANYLSTFDDVSIIVNPATQSALTTLIGGSGTPSASTVYLTGSLTTSGGSGSGAVTYASQTGTICTVVGSTVSYVAGGTCTVRGTKAADTQYQSTFDDVTITVNLAAQAALTAQIDGSGTPPASTVGLTGALSATGGSGGGAVSYSSQTPAVCAVVGTTVSYDAIGTCTVRATRAADTQYTSTFDDVTLTLNQGSQTISFAPLTDRITTDTPFTVSATGGNSGNPVTFTASGVCTHGGVNGSTITLTGMAGLCTVTAAQAGNANYTAASSVMQSFTVSDPSAEVFPPNCQMPAGWDIDPMYPTFERWSVATDSTSTGACSLKSNPLPNAAGAQYAMFAFTGVFQTGTVALDARVSSSADHGCFLIAIDTAWQNIGSGCPSIGVPALSGNVPFQAVNVPITAGTHKIWLLYYRDSNANIAGGDAAWVDKLTMPLLTSITSPLTALGTYNVPFSYQIVADNFPQFYAASGLPPGLSLNTSTGLISGTPTLPGTYPVNVTVSNPGGVAPSASDNRIITITIDKAAQSIAFGTINNRLTNAPALTVSAIGGVTGNPVTFTANGVCTSSGADGSTITLTGAVGTCSVTANQMGDAFYADAVAVQSFTVTAASSETFPPGCTFPAGWTNTAGPGWAVSENEESTTGGCSLKAQSTVGGGGRYQSTVSFTGLVGTGTISFKYRISTELNWKCFEFLIDGVAQNLGGTCSNLAGATGISGIGSGWVSVSFPVTAGTRTFRWVYDKDSDCCTFGTRDAVWIDDVVFPQYSLTVSKNGTGSGTVISDPSGIACGGICSSVLSGSVALLAFPNPGSYLSNWSGGGCSGNGACIVNLIGNTAVTATFTLIAAPTAPQSVSGTPGNGSASITFSPPASNGGAPIVSYTVTCTAASNPSGSNSGTISPITVTGLANGAAYTCGVTAFNGNFTSPPANTSVTPRTVPDAPTGLIGTPGNATISIAFTPPMNNGGAAISSYEASCNDGMANVVGTSLASPVSVSGLINGNAYACSVRAANAAGFGAFSSSINVTPRTVPDAPTSLMATAGDAQATIAFGVPANNGGAAIGSYTVTCTAAGQTTRTATGAMSPLTVTAMTNGVQYSCSATAANVAGTGAASSPVLVTPRTVPGAPTGLMAAAGDGQATISFSAPPSNGGSTISAYTGTCTASGNPDRTGTSAMSPVTVTGMTNALAYTCTVTATNAAGTGPASTAVNVTPRTVPDAPVIGVVTPGNGQATVAFSPPMSNGGAPVTGYLAFCRIPASSPPYLQTSGAMSPLVVTGMTNGTEYECAVKAQNAAGFGNDSTFVNVTPRTLPGTPTNVGASPRDGRAAFTFNAPVSDGGSPITAYTVSCNGGAQSGSGPFAPITVTGLTNGIVNSCQIVATNSAGSSTTPANISVTPGVQTGSPYWAQICTNCHAMTPALPQLNAAGTTAAVLDYAIANQPLMSAFGEVTALTQNERIAISQYLATVRPAATAATAFNTPVVIDLAPQLTLGTVSFETMEAVGVPANGALSMVSGTQITFTPTAGFVGMATFQVRGARAAPTMLQGDPISVTVTVNPPPAPVITSMLTATGTNGAMFSYQITASNTPTSFSTSPLPAGLSVSPTTGAISGTPLVGGTFMVTINATNPGGTGTATLVLTLNPAAQSITFGAQSPASRSYAPSGNFNVNPLATASSGLPVSYVSKTPAVCTLMGGNLFIIQSAGTCTIGANQSGDANFAAAPEVTQNVTITPTAPGAPIIGAATPGNNQATIAFSAPGNTGGVAISGYTATCTASGQATRTGTNAISPVQVLGMTNLVQYSCTVTATNSVNVGPASGAVLVTPDQVPTAASIVSANSATFTVNAPGSFSVIATGYPTNFTFGIVSGTLPMGVTLNTMTGVLSGTPTTAAGTPYSLILSATNTGGTGTQAFTLNVNKANQTISFAGPGSTSISAGTVNVAATATSGLAVSFASTTPATCSVAGSTVTLAAVGTCTVRASQAGDGNFNAATNVDQSFSITQGAQTISFPTQAPASRAYVASGAFGISPAATASSGLAVSYSSLTTAVCTVSVATVTMVRAGICTIAANQAGNANYAAAAQVTQSVTISSTAPGAPTLNTATGGDTKITLAFTAAANDGGASITGYTATCGGITAMGASSPIAVTGLTNGMSYSCTVTASNGTSSLASNALMATPNALPGATVWANTCGQGSCHGNPPSFFRLNVGGADATLLDYATTHPTGLMGAMNIIVGTLTPQQKIDVAQYIRDFIPTVNATTVANTPVDISVASQVFLNTPSVALTGLQQATAPANGTLSFPGGTTITYTPNMGFTGTDSFTYRGFNAGVQTDVRTVTVTVTPAAPVITSALSASGTVGAAFNYQIAATNAPASYAAPSLPAGLSVNTMTGAISGMPTTVGSASYSISATNAGGMGSAMLTITISGTPQVITFPAQATPSRAFDITPSNTFAISPTATGGASGNPIVYSSTTTGVCSVSGTTVTMVASGVCTIAANQAGNASFSAAAQVTQSVAITSTAPGAPTIGTGVAGNTQATVNFTAPANTGGLTIASYTASCNGITNTGTGSPITVSGLTNGVTYTCSVQATNGAGTSVSSGTVMITPVAIAFTGNVFSRKLHGAFTGNLPVDETAAFNAATIEPRGIGSGHQIVFVFNNPVSSATTSVTDAADMPIAGASASPSFNGNELIVTVTGVADKARVKVKATGVNGALNVETPIAFLYGDVNQTGKVTAADIAAIKAKSGAVTVDGTTYLRDINVNGGINATDVSTVKAKAGNVLP